MFDIPLGYFIAVLAIIALISIWLSPRTKTIDGFFSGKDSKGIQPSVLTLTFSQVTTWIFARSLLNVATLGYLFGISGVIAYSAYYGSFLTGWMIVNSLRKKHGSTNIQGFLYDQFGSTGTACYNLLISLRLLTEVFANLLVIGIIFGAVGSSAYTWSILLVVAVTLTYSMNGGLRASLKTDVFQMFLLIFLIAALVMVTIVHPSFDFHAILTSSQTIDNQGWILLAVALFQVLSYPMHDPVMMDRGFIADLKTTKSSFIYAFGLSVLLIFSFGLLGVFAKTSTNVDMGMLAALQQLLGTPAMFVLALALVVSAASTMDSTFSSAAKLIVMDMRVGDASIHRGRIAMVLFAIGGLILVFMGNNDLYDAVAISGTISLTLTPVILFNIFGNIRIARWSFIANFMTSVSGAMIYFLEKGGYINIIEPYLGVTSSYGKLLVVTLLIISSGLLFFIFGTQRKKDLIKVQA